ncbi:hypothetical protein [Streptomyces clavifer]|uniref:hypothetical protein n=1 Tax=Streptomyces clavifer TaxID=68188 RepID=UPI00364CDA27
MRRRVLTTAIVAILVLPITSCSGSEGAPGAVTSKPVTTDASTSGSPAGHKSKAPEKPLSQVEDDVRFATEPEGALHMHKRKKFLCSVDATVPTLKVLHGTEFKAVVKRLQTRGWTLDGPLDTVDGPSGINYAQVESGWWQIVLGSAAVPSEAAEAYTPNQGVVFIDITWTCNPG